MNSAIRITMTAVLAGIIFWLLWSITGIYVQRAFDTGRAYQAQQCKTGVFQSSDATKVIGFEPGTTQAVRE